MKMKTRALPIASAQDILIDQDRRSTFFCVTLCLVQTARLLTAYDKKLKLQLCCDKAMFSSALNGVRNAS